MKNKLTKTLATFLSLCLCVALCLSAVGCDLLESIMNEVENANHDHEATSEIGMDEKYHWGVCAVEGCDEKLEKQEHFFDENGLCPCGYERLDENVGDNGDSNAQQPSDGNGDSNVQQPSGGNGGSSTTTPETHPNKVNQDQYYAALTLQGVTSVTFKTSGTDGNTPITITRYIDVDKAKLVQSNGLLQYYEFVGGEAYAYEESGGQWLKFSAPGYKSAYVTLTEVRQYLQMFLGFYSMFNYDNGVYKYSASNGMPGQEDFSAQTIEMRFENQRLSYLVMTMTTNEGVDVIDAYLSDYNATTVTLPEING